MGGKMTEKGLTRRDLAWAIIFAAAVYLAIKFISQIADVILIFSITLLAVTILNPAVTWLQKKRIPRSLSAGLMALLTLSIVGTILYVAIPPAIIQLREFVKELPSVMDSAQTWAAKLLKNNPEISALLPAKPNTGLTEVTRPLIGGLSTFTVSAAGVVTAAFLIFISTIYILAHPEPLISGVLRFAGREYSERVREAGAKLGGQIRSWGLGLAAGMFAIFLLTWIALSIIGIKQAFLFAVIAGVLEAVPVLGPVISAVPPTIVALAQDPIMAVWVIVAFIIIQQLESHILVPMIMSRQLALHPVTVIFFVLVMAGLFGIIGIFLAAPAAATAGIIYDELYLRNREREH